MAGNIYTSGIESALAGDMDSAENLLSQSVIGAPMFADSHNNLGVVLQSRGKHEEAIGAFQRALKIKPGYGLALCNMGASLAALARHEEAEAVYRQALEIDPGNAIALGNFGAILMRHGKVAEAEAALRSALALRSDFHLAAACLGELLLASGREAEALPLWMRLVQASPDNPGYRIALSAALRACERPQEAKAHLEAARSLDPTSPEPAFRLGRILEELGDIDRAQLLFRQAIAMRSDHFIYHASLINVTKLSSDDPAFIQMEHACSTSENLDIHERINLFYAYGKALSVLNKHEKSFGFIRRANALRRSTVNYDEPRALRGLRAIRHAYSEPLTRGDYPQSASCYPIFIVGMPRSGSTLVDQILASHPEVASVGESRALPDAIRAFRVDNPKWQFPRNALEMTKAEYAQIYEHYATATAQTAAQLTGKASPRAICDKLLPNFKYIGIILKAFPNAKIIHACRNPVESCLSAFGINFADQPFTYDLGEIGRYYKEYALTMKHWHKVLPEGSILDVRYEDVVDDTEKNARKILSFCGLEWSESCLRFHETNRPVRTASVTQVRQPIYRTSLKKWQPSRSNMAPLLNALGL